AVELDYIENGIDQLSEAGGEQMSALDLFIYCLPYRFYVIQALLFLPLVARMGRDFGPMLRAERRRVAELESEVATIDGDQQELEMRGPSHWANAVVPLAVLLGVVIGLIYYTGATTATAVHAQELAE